MASNADAIGPICLDGLLNAYPLSQEHRNRLVGLGFDAMFLGAIQIGTLPRGAYLGALQAPELQRDDLLLLGIRDEAGRLRTIRVLDANTPFAQPLADLGALNGTPASEIDIGRRAFRHLPIPHVALPGKMMPGQVMVVEDDLSSSLIAAKLQIAAVSTMGMHLVENAVEKAATLAQGHRVIIALRTEGIRKRHQLMLGRALARAGALFSEVRIAQWDEREKSFGKFIARGKRFSTVTAPRAFRPMPGSAKLVPCLKPRKVLANGLWTTAQWWAGRAGVQLIRWTVEMVKRRVLAGPAGKFCQPSERYQRGLAALEVALEKAREIGARIVAFGGVATDAIAGGVLRDRKDIDLAVVGGPRDALEQIGESVAGLGYRRLFWRAGWQIKLDDGFMGMELFRMQREVDGALVLPTAYRYVALHSEALEGGEYDLAHVRVPVFVPEYLYLFKQSSIRDVKSISFRSELKRVLPLIADLRALAPHVSRQRLRFLLRSGRFRCLPFCYYSATKAATELRIAARKWTRLGKAPR